MIFKARALAAWDEFRERKGFLYPIRPTVQWNLQRIRAAWFVLIGKYDALDWEGEKHDKVL